MSAPYWGQLPPPKARRASDDMGQADRTQSSDQPASSMSQTRKPGPNRISVQTTNTEAPTESTMSPFASPVTSEFRGLAPRPPSMTYGQSAYPPELLEKRRRRSSRNREEELAFANGPPPPAAPEAPPAPASNYKHPYGNGASPYTYSASTGQPGPPRSTRRADPLRAAEMDPEEFYKDETPPAEKQARPPVLDRSRRNFDSNGTKDVETRANQSRPLHQDPRTGSVRRPSNGTGSRREKPSAAEEALPGRKDSVSSDAQRKPWADDRSPLQRLELTLGSITKEEKRARVIAAEQRARERAATEQKLTGAEPDQPAPQSDLDRSPTQQVRFRERKPSVGQDDRHRPVVAGPAPTQVAVPGARGPLSQNPPRDDRRQVSATEPRSQIPVPKTRDVSGARDADLPQRNLSFRDRTAKDEAPVPSVPANHINGEPTYTVSATGPVRATSVNRSGSNKLKKNPPGDPWFYDRMDAEQRAANRQVTPQRGAQPRGMQELEDAPDSTSTVRTRDTTGTIKRRPVAQQHQQEPEQDLEGFLDSDEPPKQTKADRILGLPAGLSRSVSQGTNPRRRPADQDYPLPKTGLGPKSVSFHGAEDEDEDDIIPIPDTDEEPAPKESLLPIQGVYRPPKFLDEWKKATVGTLAGSLLDIGDEVEPKSDVDKNKAWWEDGGSAKRRGSMSSRPQKAEAFDGEYDDTNNPTRFKPALYLKCGPLLRYCGIRHERTQARANRAAPAPEREIWRGSVMIVTQNSESKYDITPTLRLFVQPIDLLPPPPMEIHGEQALSPEYVDPIAGIPKLGRRGETLYVRPVEHMEEGKDVSMLEPDDGLFEMTRSAPDFEQNAVDPPGSFTSRRKRIAVDGEKVGKYKDVRGFRLHTERGCTFWRFNIEVELREKQQRIAYRINRGPATGFWVPARGQAMNVMFHTCNGFSLSVKPDDLSGPDPMWRDVLNTHQTQPFHVMIGGGDQIYNDAVMRETTLFRQWLDIHNPLHKQNAPLNPEMQHELESFYLERYCKWFSQGLFGLANSQIPMVNMYDDHDIIDGYGSYGDNFMRSPVFSGLGNIAFKYYMLFQHQSVMEETEESEPSWAIGATPGPYIHERSRSLFMSLGSNVALLAVDTRTERTKTEVVKEDTWRMLIDRCYAEITKGKTQHLLVLLGVPIAYPRLTWLENIVNSRLMDPIKLLSKVGILSKFFNRFDGSAEILDDLDDHWTAKGHKDERKYIIEDLQDLAADKSLRITLLSGDVHLAAIGQFSSNPKLHIAKHEDFRYMPNIISSAIVNTPPPENIADIVDRRDKIHYFDKSKETLESMVPIFTQGVDGKPRRNQRLLAHRNWCSIRPYQPGQTPPPTPPPEFDQSPEGSPPGSRGGMFRRLSLSRTRGPAVRPDAAAGQADRSRPPLSGGSFMRTFSRRGSSSDPDGRGRKPNVLMRTLSLDRGRDTSAGTRKRSFSLFGRRPSLDQHQRPDDGGINGDWGVESDEDLYDAPPPRNQPQSAFANGGRAPGGAAMSIGAAGAGMRGSVNLRGGAGNPRDMKEYEDGDESYFTTRITHRAATQPAPHPDESTFYPDEDITPDATPTAAAVEPMPRPFHRTPTTLSAKQIKRGAQHYAVDLEGGLDICINVEVNAKDPAGITVPYRLLVPKLCYEYTGEDAPQPEPKPLKLQIPDQEQTHVQEPGGLQRWFSGRGSQRQAHPNEVHNPYNKEMQ